MTKLLLSGLFALSFGFQNSNAQAESLSLVSKNMQIVVAPSAAVLKARILSVKANMMSYQTMVETYGVDWGGEYPSNLKVLNNNTSDKFWEAKMVL